MSNIFSSHFQLVSKVAVVSFLSLTTITTHHLVLQKQLAYACTFTFLQVVLSIYMVICKKTHEQLFPFFIPFASQTQPHWVEMVIIRRTFSVCSISNNIAMWGKKKKSQLTFIYMYGYEARNHNCFYAHTKLIYTRRVREEEK